MKILLTVFLFCLLFPIGLAQAGPTFPAVIPFTSIYYVTPPSANGDQLVVGKMASITIPKYYCNTVDSGVNSSYTITRRLVACPL